MLLLLPPWGISNPHLGLTYVASALKEKKYQVEGYDLNIEIYNDLNVAAIVTENEETITSRDIYDESFSEIYRTFYSPSMPKTPSL